jgi:hydroxypyruvate reductase
MITRSLQQLRDDALAIWQAGVNAVRANRLIADNVQVIDDLLLVAGHEFALRDIDRIVVVGAGKAGAGMARGLEQALGERVLREKHVKGWVNVPADCVTSLATIHLHPARPAGQNEPTPAGVFGTERIMELVQSLQPRDLCICLISGGGSALLPLPVTEISLDDKLALTRFLSAAGANIQALNTVRKQLSRVKGGGLARACRAGTLVSLILSDVLGDPLDLIASGPTVVDHSTPLEALRILDKYDPKRKAIAASIYQYLERKPTHTSPELSAGCIVNEVIGNLAVAVDAAGVEAERRGYSHAMFIAREPEGAADDVGRHHATQACHMRSSRGPDCLITGGEPVVKLAPTSERGRGGRNQQLVLAAAESWQQSGTTQGMVLLSGGTDGEDGPTPAAGAILDETMLTRASAANLDLHAHLLRNDAYPFFEQVGGLIHTGPTHTNVGDIRVVVVDRIEPQTRKAHER